MDPQVEAALAVQRPVRETLITAAGAGDEEYLIPKCPPGFEFFQNQHLRGERVRAINVGNSGNVTGLVILPLTDCGERSNSKQILSDPVSPTFIDNNVDIIASSVSDINHGRGSFIQNHHPTGFTEAIKFFDFHNCQKSALPCVEQVNTTEGSNEIRHASKLVSKSRGPALNHESSHIELLGFGPPPGSSVTSRRSTREDVKVDWPYFGQGVWRFVYNFHWRYFNKILSDDEYVSQRHLRPQWQMDSFRHVVKDCGIIDIGYSAFAFTWCNNFISPSSTRAKLDRCLASKSWRDRFLRAQLQHLSTNTSDHLPILLILGTQSQSTPQQKTRFKFEGVTFYKQLFTSQNGGNLANIDRLPTRHLGTNSQAALEYSFTSEEVRKCLFSMTGNKSSGTDGSSILP
ncbi:hypothetical protein LIER_25482 [Lithospermum erythrorhizon]|uniref:Uncharacterized protein n=1 Tax=Lithospermum erythrorhizon TaxID=34254 RepID=A0AAV3R4W7_LITER